MEQYTGRESNCQSIFASDPAEIRKNFMNLWLGIICEKEVGLGRKEDRQTAVFDL